MSIPRQSWKPVLLLVSAILWGAPARAQVTNDPGNDDNTEAKIQQAIVPPKLSLLTFDEPAYTGLRDAKRQLKERIGLDIVLESTTIYQVASGVRPSNQAVETTTAISGLWTIWQHENKIDAMGFGFNAENRSNYSGPSFVDMTRDLGSLWSPNDASSDDYSRINQLWFGQRLLEGKVTYIVGKIDAGSYLNGNRFAASTNTQYFSQPFSTNPARSFPENGLGAVGRFAPVDWFQLQGEFSDGDAHNNGSPFTTISGNWFKAGEVVFIPKIPGLGEGRYRAMIYQKDSKSATTSGWALSFDQNITDDYGVFFRYGNNDGKVNAINQIAATGFNWLRPFGRKDDQAGIAVSWTKPSDHSLRDGYSAEIFYRLQLTHFVELSPSIQAIHPSARNEDIIGVFGLRLRVLF